MNYVSTDEDLDQRYGILYEHLVQEKQQTGGDPNGGT